MKKIVSALFSAVLMLAFSVSAYAGCCDGSSCCDGKACCRLHVRK